MDDDLKARVCAAIDQRRDDLTAFAQAVAEQPELGFFETQTAQRFSQALTDLGVAHETGLALTGIKAVLAGGAPGPTVAVLGELDALPVRGHPLADPTTGAAHACGHHAQLAMVLGVARGLLESGALPDLAGRVALMAVPAEEYVELERRLALRAEGHLEFLGGKAELLRLGAFDDVDLAMMVHTSSEPDYRSFWCWRQQQRRRRQDGPLRRPGRARRRRPAPGHQRAQRRARRPWRRCTRSARPTATRTTCASTRSSPRVATWLTPVPADARLELFCRGASLEAISDASAKVDRALKAGALAIGARVEVTTLPGDLPMRHDPLLVDLFRANAERLVGATEVVDAGHAAARPTWAI